MPISTLTDRLSLRSLLTLPYVVLVLTLVLLMAALSWRAGRDTVDTLCGQLVAEAVNRIGASLARHVGGADAVLAASIFHFGEHTVGEAKALMAARGIPVRI